MEVGGDGILTYAHVFDQTNTKTSYDSHGKTQIDDTPIRYSNNGTTLGYCNNDYEYTDGQVLFSGSLMQVQKSCKPNTGNAGNYYSWPTATAGGSKSSGDELNSVCPKGWKLSSASSTDLKSYYYQIKLAYGVVDNNDSQIKLLPFSFIRSGYYYFVDSKLTNRENEGRLWLSERKLFLFSSKILDANNKDAFKCDANNGYPLRCVDKMVMV